MEEYFAEEEKIESQMAIFSFVIIYFGLVTILTQWKYLFEVPIPFSVFLVALPFLCLGWMLYVVNNFFVLQARCKNAKKQIDIEQKARADLLPQLVTVIKAHAEHEKSMMERIAAMRDPSREALTQIFVLDEKYPDLKLSKSFTDLRTVLIQVEQKLGHARSTYNQSVAEYNVYLQTIPYNFFARGSV